MKKMLLSGQMEKEFEWIRWVRDIPYLEFPSHWRVKIIPPFVGAVVRFLIRTDQMPKDERVSVYLDCYDNLGSVGEPYWEVYPNGGDIMRCSMNDTGGLLQAIGEAILSLETRKN